MAEITHSSAFLFIWIGFTALMIVCIGLIFLWGVRTRQFSDQERARYLPLDDENRDLLQSASETQGHRENRQVARQEV
ncbi:cbb3-type cytochrome oxidase assembly protein CcoS [Geobacter sp. DSM 9736]|uniref:cbb3-type cytochrome oxidase assembly protein CcoS n=1 Tax=Geobacter sp. DSM 9736 TaxID=1277350 RepID=UPI000B511E9C|nr:cbb3-type cytochrome oxidase assembly protein CcoS [Geobacter sp. DSM 9736]SNB46684.1 cytochrome oxidase maturation protein, cbb3-type [Geobacter sp. DSM 9736]